MTEKDGEKKIEDMDSGEFIAHVFYNVLGGLYANEEIDARLGVLEMVEDIKQSREELRTRVAELEKELRTKGEMFLCEENARLRKELKNARIVLSTPKQTQEAERKEPCKKHRWFFHWDEGYGSCMDCGAIDREMPSPKPEKEPEIDEPKCAHEWMESSFGCHSLCKKCGVRKEEPAKKECECAKIIRESDPLEANCDWEDSESIAYGVKKHLLERLKDLKGLEK